MAIIMTLIGTLLTAMVMAREWERGTMEALLVTPVRRLEIVLGKLIPYFMLGMGGLVLCIVMAVFLFNVPFRGSLVLLLLLGGVFMVGTLGLGLFISSTAKNQFVAGQIALLAAFLPSFFLSGFIFELTSTPIFIQVLSYIVPAKYFVNIVQTLFLAGNVGSVLLPNLAGLVVLALVFMTLAFRKTRKSLE
jgi:ABC-2 type transport system permease protein